MVNEIVGISFDNAHIHVFFLPSIPGNHVVPGKAGDSCLSFGVEIIGRGGHCLVVVIAVMADGKGLFPERNGIGKALVSGAFVIAFPASVQSGREDECIIAVRQAVYAYGSTLLVPPCFFHAGIIHRQKSP